MSQLENKAREIRGIILDQIFAFKNGHIASAFSCVEILLTLYWRVLKVNGANPDWEDRDRLILSKGHGVSALYAVLADLGFFPKEHLISLQDGNLLGGHADWKVPGVDWSTGSLGHGLSVAAGMALAAKIDGKSHRVFCVLGDGELQEGSVWEAAMFAAHHRLNNLIAIVDSNGYQSCGKTEHIVSLRPQVTKWEAFGWDAAVIEGHNFSALTNTLNKPRISHNRPFVCITCTIKGRGVSFIEAGDQWHTSIPDGVELMEAKKELGLA